MAKVLAEVQAIAKGKAEAGAKSLEKRRVKPFRRPRKLGQRKQES